MGEITIKLLHFYNKVKKLLIIALKGEWIEKTEILLKRNVKNIFVSEVKIAFWASWFFLVIVVGSTYIFFKYKGDFPQNIFVEAHGMLFDLFIIATFLLWLNKKTEKRRQIEKWQEEIDDFRGWESEEAMHRIVGNIKRLNKKGVTKINLSYCHLINAKLGKDPQHLVDYTEGALDISDLMERSRGRLIITKEAKKYEWVANLQEATLIKANLHSTNLMLVNFRKANLYQANLQGAYLFYADFKDANLRKANLQYTSFGATELKGANLMEANLLGARYLSIAQLAEVKTLYKAKLEQSLLKNLKESYPRLLERPS